MKNMIVCAVLLIAFFAMPTLSNAQSKADEAQLLQLMQDGHSRFKAKDAAGFASLFAENAVFVEPNGQIIDGKIAIEQAHAELFKMVEPGNADILVSKVTFIEADLALVFWTYTAEAKFMGQSQTEKASTVLTAVKKEGKWVAISLGMVPVRPMPGN